MVDAVVTAFLEKLLDTLQEEGRIISEFKDQFEKLQRELRLMQSFLKDADRLKRKNETLRAVMANLRELIYEAEDILADCQLQSRYSEQITNGWISCIYPPKVVFQYQRGKRLREINGKVANVKLDISTYLGMPILAQPGTADGQNDQMTRWSSPVYDHSQVVGLEGDTKKLKDWLLEADQELLAIGVVGMGGLGKTTIVHKVFNDRDMENHFDRRIWISVSQTFTEEQIMRSILRNLGDASVGDDRGELLRKIKQYLLGKRFLIVMDDVWSEDVTWWKRISEGLPKGNGSSLIITTRNEKVAKKMGVADARNHWPKLLSNANSWLLFRKVAFAATAGECTHPELEDVGKEIVDKCRGLPLAIKAVGGILLCKPPRYREWRRIADHFRDELAENDDSVMSSLQLSYDELPSYLKSCFLSFSLYPEDCVITKEQVIHWWIGEGFVPLRKGRPSTEAGEDCFSGLTNRCLVEVVDKTYNGVISTCKIHDMVRDLVIRMAVDDAFFSADGMSCRHLGITSHVEKQQLRAMRGLLSTTKTGEVNKIESITAKRFSDCKYLRVLDVSKSIFERPLTGLLCQISSLQHLTYLSLSCTHPLIRLPSQLEKLHNLQILDLSYCQNLKMLPPYLVSFTKLKILDISHCGSLEHLPKGLGRLSNLEILLGFKPARSNQGCRISELGNLTKLRSLALHLTHEDEIENDETDALANLKQLYFLTLSCFDSHDSSDLIAKLDKLNPPEQLDELCIKFYPGKTSPAWLNPISLPMLRFLSLSSGNLVKMHQSFWGNNTWKIEGLMLESLSELAMEWPVVQQAMPLIRIVNASWCPELEGFPVEDSGFRGGLWAKEEHRGYI